MDKFTIYVVYRIGGNTHVLELEEEANDSPPSGRDVKRLAREYLESGIYADVPDGALFIPGHSIELVSGFDPREAYGTV